ncbi:MAG: UDP-N-acetylmuramoyl-L-alanine--D-glutamate ligase [Desulfobulbaceae bacterium]|nr:UDP-N-acetylmuramoyl-L-alanine--D-glutamate ligase [Desulfobulbaceae bacterium]
MERYALIIGLGKSGMAAVRYLHSKGFQLAVSDAGNSKRLGKRELEVLEQLGVELEFGGHTDRLLRANSLVVPSPGVPLDLPLILEARKRDCTIAGELAIAADELRIPTICVTGTNGKTTVTSLIGDMVKASGKKTFVGGNIGTPLLEYLLAPADIEVAVLELSSFQLENIGSFRPNIAVLLNITPDHIDRHGSMANYMAAKKNIFLNQHPQDYAIIGDDDPALITLTTDIPACLFRFGHNKTAHGFIDGTDVHIQMNLKGNQTRETYSLGNTRLLSGVNGLNAAAAILAARAFGCEPAAIRRAIMDFHPPLHRMTPVRELHGVEWINDSKATNIGAVQAALAGCTKPVILIAGGRSKGDDFRTLCPIISQKVKKVLLIGEASREMEQAFGTTVSSEQMRDMDDAVRRAAILAIEGDLVLLAPGCASFDMFRNYEHRGEVFSRAVLNLPEHSTLREQQA